MSETAAAEGLDVAALLLDGRHAPLRRVIMESNPAEVNAQDGGVRAQTRVPHATCAALCTHPPTHPPTPCAQTVATMSPAMKRQLHELLVETLSSEQAAAKVSDPSAGAKAQRKRLLLMFRQSGEVGSLHCGGEGPWVVHSPLLAQLWTGLAEPHAAPPHAPHRSTQLARCCAAQQPAFSRWWLSQRRWLRQWRASARRACLRGWVRRYSVCCVRCEATTAAAAACRPRRSWRDPRASSAAKRTPRSTPPTRAPFCTTTNHFTPPPQFILHLVAFR